MVTLYLLSLNFHNLTKLFPFSGRFLRNFGLERRWRFSPVLRRSSDLLCSIQIQGQALLDGQPLYEVSWNKLILGWQSLIALGDIGWHWVTISHWVTFSDIGWHYLHYSGSTWPTSWPSPSCCGAWVPPGPGRTSSGPRFQRRGRRRWSTAPKTSCTSTLTRWATH